MREITSYFLPYKSKEKVSSIQEDGSEIIKNLDVEKKIKVILKEPSRADSEAAKNIYLETWSDCVKRGILTRAVIEKKYRETEGILTPREVELLEKIKTRIQEIRTEYQKIEVLKEKSADDKQKIFDLIGEFQVLEQQLTEIEDLNETLFSNTAETIANEKRISWNIMFLTNLEIDGKISPLVSGDTLDQKLENFDKIAADDSSPEAKEKAELYDKILTRNTYYVHWLSHGRIDKEKLGELNAKIEAGEITI